MTGEEKILIISVLAVGALALIIFLLYRFVDKTFFDYNECTGKRELKSKIKAQSERLNQIYLKNQQKKAVLQNTAAPKKSTYERYSPDLNGGEEMVYVKVVTKEITPATENSKAYYMMNFMDLIYGDQYILPVDRETYESTKLEDRGTLYYKHSKKTGYVFCHFEAEFNVLK